MKRTFSVHLTNVKGTGAIQLLTSLLPEFENVENAKLDTLYLPEKGPLANYIPKDLNITSIRYNRYLPNSLSRVLECTLFAYKFYSKIPLFVVGDIPLFGIKNQILLLQNAHLVSKKKSSYGLKFFVMRFVFRLNIIWVKSIIVQTNYMKDLLLSEYPSFLNKIFVINQPVPNWLISNDLKKYAPDKLINKINLFYPAAYYKHKNHNFLNKINFNKKLDWPINCLYLTIDEKQSPSNFIEWIKCVGLLNSNEMIEIYSKTDALIFLSDEESYGFPLIEAMFIGLPIICPDLPYARTLCGSEAIYYIQNDIISFNKAILKLIFKINNGWWPNWQLAISGIPKNWNETACNINKVIFR